MASHIVIELDTTAPQTPAASINSGASSTASRDVSAAISTSDPDTTGYEIKIWGAVDEAANANIQQDEVDSSWMTLATPHPVKLSTGDGSKTLKFKLRDDVWNETAEFTDSITLDTSAPVVTLSVPPEDKYSEVDGKDIIPTDLTADADFEEFKIKVVPSTGSLHTAGTQIGTTNGSENVSGSAGGYPKETPIAVEINTSDLKAASSGDGDKIIKAFVRDSTGNWSTV